MNNSGITVALLAYGEEENLRILLPKLHRNLMNIGEPFEIVVVDAAKSTDNTEEVCKKNGALYFKQEEPAFGGAFRTAIKYTRLDKFLILDADCSHDPDAIPSIYRKFIDGYDVVIGSRYVEGGISNDSGFSVIMSKTLNAVFRICLGIKAKDISTDFRMYRTEQLKAIATTCLNYDVLQEVLVQLSLNKPTLNIGEVPITFHKRESGQSKRKLLKFVRSYILTLINLSLLRLAKTREKQALYRNTLLYVIFGVLAAGLEYLVFTALLDTYLSKFPEIANVIGNACGFIFAFSTNTYLNFKSKGKILQRLLSYGAISILGLSISTSTISLLKNTMDLRLLKAILLIVVSAMQFTLNRLITYRK